MTLHGKIEVRQSRELDGKTLDQAPPHRGEPQPDDTAVSRDGATPARARTPAGKTWRFGGRANPPLSGNGGNQQVDLDAVSYGNEPPPWPVD